MGLFTGFGFAVFLGTGVTEAGVMLAEILAGYKESSGLKSFCSQLNLG